MMFLRALALTAAPLGLAATVALAPVPAVAQQNGLAEVQAHLRAINSMTANFSQTDARGRTLTGTLALKRPGKIRFEYGRGVDVLVVADGKRGAQALSARILDAPPSLSKMSRKPADDMAIIVEDLVKLLDGIGTNLKRGRYPESGHSHKIAAMLRKVADELDA